MSCYSAELALATYHNQAWAFECSPTTWKRFRDDMFVVWTHGSAALNSLLDNLINLDDTRKIKFTMQIAEENELEFIDLKVKIAEGKTNIDVYSKPPNSFTYTLLSTCYLYQNIHNISKVIAFRLRRICDKDERYN